MGRMKAEVGDHTNTQRELIREVRLCILHHTANMAAHPVSLQTVIFCDPKSVMKEPCPKLHDAL